MATYLILNLSVLLVVYFLLRPKHLFSKASLVTLASILVLTLVFDNIMVYANLFYYTDSKLLGVLIVRAPIEDFFYALLAVMVVPSLWERFAAKDEL